ncbi:MAG TPA: N-acetylmuramic acid 6-phosphate etherase [Gaiellaceae bacterium]|nr:N-acetylmuramic acid 6-phosphate etherase [Gaiellaceae bacterium]
MTAFDQLGTEARDAGGADLDLRSTIDLVEVMNAADATVPAAVGEASASIAALVEAAAERLGAGGRLIYVGAGTSGLLAALDAAECESTFGAAPDQVVALVAGAAATSTADRDAAEDDAGAGAAEVEGLGLTADDVVVGISASGRSPYVLGALDAARTTGALTACVVCVEDSPIAALAEHEVCVPVGPEVLAGSTRLKAGTAQKLVLNTISTVTMIRLGKTYGNLLVDVAGTNEKLRARMRRIVGHATGAPAEQVDDALAAADGEAKVAIVSLLTGLEASDARARLREAGGVVRRALGT